MALVMQPALFPSWLLHYFLTSFINFQQYVLRAYFGQVLGKKWIKTIMLSVSMEYKILVREIDIKSGDHVKNAIFGISRSWFNVMLVTFWMNNSIYKVPILC